MSQHLLEFDNPPVNEVVCGILFERLEKFLNSYLGLLWENYQPEYSESREVAPLPPVVERFDNAPQQPYVDVPPLPRTWFVHTNDNGILQVQRDRFLHNWRKVRPDDEYPRYHKVIERFRTHLSTFTTFLEEHNLGVVKPIQYELTYINHIMQGEGWEAIGDVGKVFPHFGWHLATSSFPPLPETINWQTSFVLPDYAGRLHTRIHSAIRRQDEHPLFRFELTARGIGDYTTLEAMWDWFELAHEWIVLGFDGLTDRQVQQDIWRRKI
jgi:uncharacterized protein (TIGR04255 family)